MLRRYIGKAIKSARTALMNKFVPFHLGLDHSREYFIEHHTRDLAKYLFANGKDITIIVADGTYTMMGKSSGTVK